LLAMCLTIHLPVSVVLCAILLSKYRLAEFPTAPYTLSSNNVVTVVPHLNVLLHVTMQRRLYHHP